MGVDRSGNLFVDLYPDDGSTVRVKSSGVSLNDGSIHDITVQFDGEAGFAEILIDGRVAGSAEVSGALRGTAGSIIFGNPWGDQNFAGELSGFSLSAETRDFQLYGGDIDLLPENSSLASEADDSSEDINTSTPEQNESASTGGDEVIDEGTQNDTGTTPQDGSQIDSGTSSGDSTEPHADDDASSSRLQGGYQLDIADLMEGTSGRLHDDAEIVEMPAGQAISFDGKKDYVTLDGLEAFRDSEQIAFSVDFSSEVSNHGAQRLVWNHMKIGLTLEGDGLRIHAANTQDPFWKGFQIDGLGLNDGGIHNATVMLDAEEERLQVIVDDTVVFEELGTDFELVGAGGHEWGWSLGTSWNRWFEGEVYNLQITNDFEFVEVTAAGSEWLI